MKKSQNTKEYTPNRMSPTINKNSGYVVLLNGFKRNRHFLTLKDNYIVNFREHIASNILKQFDMENVQFTLMLNLLYCLIKESKISTRVVF